MYKSRYERLCDCVTSWDTLYDGFKHFYLYNYYPLTCNFSISPEEWNIRKIVWDFKNNPDKTSVEANRSALFYIINFLMDFLKITFGKHLPELTLVCIPASTLVKNEARYKMFSELLCRFSGIANAYPQIQIIQDKIEKREGGTGIDFANIVFNENFFKNRNILLFDDVVTSGDSMKKFDLKMRELGANVVGGISIGKTRHERVVDNPIDLFQNKYIK